MPAHFIGLISGTSMDSIDAVVASFGDSTLELHATHAHPYPGDLRERLRRAIHDPDACGLDQLGSLDRRVGECFRDAALAVIQKSGIEQDEIAAIGSHGQTLRHRPDDEYPFTLQIGDAAVIAGGTGITTVADFRRADIAAGGQGAPLTPPFHDWLFRSRDRHRVVLNIGGIANVTVLPADNSAVIGFDTGPGNTLLDAWIREQGDLAFDDGGVWAASGQAIDALLEKMAADEYFARTPPKSTGFEYFNPAWLRGFDVAGHKPADVQATLCELTAYTIASAIREHARATRDVFVCGGGVHNRDMMERLSRYLPETRICSTSEAGLDPDYVEAAAFAWLAMRTISQQSGNLPTVTGASRKVTLGAIHSP